MDKRVDWMVLEIRHTGHCSPGTRCWNFLLPVHVHMNSVNQSVEQRVGHSVHLDVHIDNTFCLSMRSGPLAKRRTCGSILVGAEWAISRECASHW